MRRVRLSRNAFLNESYCTSGSVITLPADAALAPFMTQLPDEDLPGTAHVATPAASPDHHGAPDKTVTVHYKQNAAEVDIDLNGVAMHVEHAALKVEVD